MANNQIPLCVDLDGTIIKTDLLHESSIKFIKKNPFNIFLMLWWLTKGRAFLKKQLANKVKLDIDLLPYNQEVIKYCEEAGNSGQQIFLVTASNESYAQKFLKKFDFLSGSWGSSENINLKGKVKAEFLAENFNNEGFDYIGDSSVDLPVWKAARK